MLFRILARTRWYGGGNGLLLAKQAEALARAGMQRVNVSIDTVDPVKFKKLTEDKDFFEIYGQQQNKLKLLEEKWTILVEELENMS